MRDINNLKGFTLVELSIVLVIIGLIVASVTAGKSLIRAAQIRALITQINTIETGINSFQDRYNAIPGDFSNAYAIFGSNNPPGCTSASQCNGNGNNIIDYIRGTNNQHLELYNAFLHLYLTGSISGYYDGTNLPFIKYQGQSIYIDIRYAPGDSNTGIFGRAGHIIEIGFIQPSDYMPQNLAFTPLQAQEIDTKIDDGIANTGKIYGVGGGSGCAGWSTIGGSNYDLTIKAVACSITYWMQSI